MKKCPISLDMGLSVKCSLMEFYRCMNAGEHTEEFIGILKEIADRPDIDKDIKERAQEYADFQTNRTGRNGD